MKQVPFEQFGGVSYDQWMNVSGILGVAIILVSFYLVLRNWAPPHSFAIRFGRRVGYVLIALPLFSRWYLSESLLFSIGVCIVFISSVKLLLVRKGI